MIYWSDTPIWTQHLSLLPVISHPSYIVEVIIDNLTPLIEVHNECIETELNNS